MNTESVEELLRKAPRVLPPAGLLESLQADVNLSLPRKNATNHSRSETPSLWLRRWIPALGFGLWLVGCLVVLGVQGSRIVELRQQNSALQSTLPSSNHQNPESVESAQPAAEELVQLRKDALDVQRLRAEIDQLRSSLASLPKLQAENAQLRAELISQRTPQPKPEEDFFAAQKDRASRVRCVNNLKQVCLAARIWANKSKSDAMPKDFESMKPYIKDSEKLLLCPKDGALYEMLSPGASETHPNVVFVRCPVHNIVGLVDGSVQGFDSGVTLENTPDGVVIKR